MKHHVATRRFSRTTNQLKALLNGLVMELVERGQITTTLPKAKETLKATDRILASVKNDDVATHRRLQRQFGKRSIAQRIVKVALNAKQIRLSGFVTMVRTGMRKGDGAQLAQLTLKELPKLEAAPTTVKKIVKKVAPVKKVAAKTAKPTAKKK